MCGKIYYIRFASTEKMVHSGLKVDLQLVGWKQVNVVFKVFQVSFQRYWKICFIIPERKPMFYNVLYAQCMPMFSMFTMFCSIFLMFFIFCIVSLNVCLEWWNYSINCCWNVNGNILWTGLRFYVDMFSSPLGGSLIFIVIFLMKLHQPWVSWEERKISNGNVFSLNQLLNFNNATVVQ